ncbi:Aste57867_18571 [Aphanomyces stellatus]|uniref:Aste57867_18571 protein n=1 Tax=Aphanomyces stellatus TaxID=120398 RepID=A0A485LAS7_9STRA|nr:hypothetical protein As57867_018509 [Aphanomyces stellatus]VFT95307.1 Aste57867_18571 [Aphanomyces stellatus]
MSVEGAPTQAASTALGLPAVPPSSDPQRLLSYVLQIMPQYTSMELSATHFRLYNQHLLSTVEHLKQSLAMVQDRVRDEEEKRFFLEKYASEVVKERNELLHHKGKKTHKLWHNCCRKHAAFDLDVTPSIASLRGEKLTEVNLELKQAHDALREKDRLLQAAQHVVQTKQIEFDVHMTTCRRERDQLHNFISQISGLQTSQERLLYEAQSQVAREVEVRDRFHAEMDQLHHRLEALEDEVGMRGAALAAKEAEITQLQASLEKAAEVERELQRACNRLAQPNREVEIEALKSQIEALETRDIKEITRRYTKHIHVLELELKKHERTIDELQHALVRTQPMTLDEMSEHGSWNDSFGGASSAAVSRNDDHEEAMPSPPPLWEDSSMGTSHIRHNSQAMSHSSEAASDDDDRQAILQQLQLLVAQSSQRRQEEEAKVEVDQQYLTQVRRRIAERSSANEWFVQERSFKVTMHKVIDGDEWRESSTPVAHKTSHLLDLISDFGVWKSEALPQTTTVAAPPAPTKTRLYCIPSIMDIVSIDPIDETFTVKLTLYVLWPVDLDAVGLSDVVARAVAHGHYTNMTPDEQTTFAAASPTPGITLFNAVEWFETPAADIRVYGGRLGRPTYVMWNRSLHVKLRERWELGHFPFDIQDLSLDLRLNDAKSWDVFDLTVASVQFHRAAVELTEFRLLAPCIQRETPAHKATKVRLRVQRIATYYVQNIVVIMCLLSLLGPLVFVLDVDDLGDRLSTVLTLLLTAVAFKFVISSALPKVPYNTLLDSFVLASTISLVLVAFLCTVPKLLVTDDNLQIPRLVNMVLGYVALGIAVGIPIVWSAVVRVTVYHSGDTVQPVELVAKKNWYHFQFSPTPFIAKWTKAGCDVSKE